MALIVSALALIASAFYFLDDGSRVQRVQDEFRGLEFKSNARETRKDLNMYIRFYLFD